MPNPSPARPSVFIYEDEPEQRNAYVSTLSQWLVEVVAPESLTAAAEIALAKPFTVAILDNQVPSEPDLGALVLAQNPSTKIYIASGRARARAELHESSQVGVVYLQKPLARRAMEKIAQDAIDLFYRDASFLTSERVVRVTIEAVAEAGVDASFKDPQAGWTMLSLPRKSFEFDLQASDVLDLIVRFGEDGSLAGLRLPSNTFHQRGSGDHLADLEAKHGLTKPESLGDPAQSQEYLNRLQNFFRQGKS